MTDTTQQDTKLQKYRLVRRIFSIIKLLLLAYFRYDFTIKNYELGDILC